MASSDSNNFSSSSPHRLPTLTASQALHDLKTSPKSPIPTGLRSLDAALQGRSYNVSYNHNLIAGLSRGEVTEVYGPPGVGKTQLAMQASANALHAGGSVVWVDASYKLIISRLRDILMRCEQPQSQTPNPGLATTGLDNFHHYVAPTLAHLLALLAQQSPAFPPPETSLLVIDSVSTLFGLAFPKNVENIDHQQTPVKKSDSVHWASNRRWAVMGDFVSKIGRFAATKNLVIILTNQTATKIRSENGTILHPAITGNAWDTGISNRIVLYRDWLHQTTNTSSSQKGYEPGARFAGIIRAKGISYEDTIRTSTFNIGMDGLHETSEDHVNVKDASSVLPVTAVKRKREENTDSQSEDDEAISDREFGWAADDTTLNIEEQDE